MSRSRRPSVGIGAGINAAFGGVGFVLTTPSVWGYALVPMVTVLVLACGFGIAGFYGAFHLVQSYLPDFSDVARWFVTLLSGFLFLIASIFLALALAQPLSGWALEAISRKQSKALEGREPAELGFFTAFWLSLRCSLFTLVAGGGITIGLFLITLAFPPAVIVTVPLKLLVVAGFLAWDMVDYPLSLQGLGVRGRIAWVRANLGAFLAFGVTWSLLLLLPGVALFLLPLGVAGATRLVVATE